MCVCVCVCVCGNGGRVMMKAAASLAVSGSAL